MWPGIDPDKSNRSGKSAAGRYSLSVCALAKLDVESCAAGIGLKTITLEIDALVGGRDSEVGSGSHGDLCQVSAKTQRRGQLSGI